jgi:predicted enzyme involved in methoxymalonyl-ACP biosynthesis
LKRDMEYAMMDALVAACRKKGIAEIYGYYYPTSRNGMVKDFYADMGFVRISGDAKGNTAWKFIIPREYTGKNHHIEVV